MSLLIKALDKAQEQAQEVKAKQAAEKASAVALSTQKTPTPKAVKQKSSTKEVESADASQALSFETVQPNVDMRLADSDVAIDFTDDRALSLSPTDSKLSELIAKADAPIAPALSAQDNDVQSYGARPASAIANESAHSNAKSNTKSNKSASTPASVDLNTSASMAANVFNAKRVAASNQNTKLALLACAALLGLLAIGAYFYWQLNLQPAPQMPARPVQGAISAVTPPAPTEPVTPANLANPATAVAPTAAPVLPLEAVADAPAAGQDAPEKMPELALASQEAQVIAKDVQKPKAVNKQKKTAKTEEFDDTEAEPVVAESAPSMAASNKVEETNRTAKKRPIQGIASNSATIRVTKGNAQAALNPSLMRAYEAYNAGSYSEAQKLYKQVLQNDVRNVDALLGLGAIASRQGRLADANGWYGKVLELEPRNSIAQAALVSIQAENQPDYASAHDESHIKNMLAKQPDDANLHAALGAYYADKSQWPSAQQAYFDAYRLSPTADNAFNLAVSLDQMRKPKLALPYYQRALALADNTSNLDKPAIQARILAIE